MPFVNIITPVEFPSPLGGADVVPPQIYIERDPKKRSVSDIYLLQYVAALAEARAEIAELRKREAAAEARGAL